MCAHFVKKRLLTFAWLFVGFWRTVAYGSGFYESFTTDGLLGTGKGVNYEAGANWTVAVGVANLNLYYADRDGYIRIGYDHSSSVGPLDGPPYMVVRNDTLGAGTYEARFETYRPKLMFGYQNPNNYYYVIADRQYRSTVYSGAGQFGVVFGQVVEGVDTVLAGADTLDGVEEDVGDIAILNVEWDPVKTLVTVSAEWTDSTGTTIKFAGQAFQVSDPNIFENGKLGLGTATTVLTEVDWVRFTPPPPPSGTVIYLH
jgi:hypothetical protein